MGGEPALLYVEGDLTDPEMLVLNIKPVTIVLEEEEEVEGEEGEGEEGEEVEGEAAGGEAPAAAGGEEGGEKADLTGAQLNWSNLTGAKIDESQLEQAAGLEGLILPDESIYGG